MTRQEVKDFMERIRSYYPKQFIIDNYKINEWNSTLQFYDKDDVNAKFEQHQRNEEFRDKVPSLDFLIKYLTPSTSRTNDFAYECRKCHKVFGSKKDYESHYERCMQISTIVRDMNRYFNLSLTREQFDKYDDMAIETIYYNYIEKMLSLKAGLSVERRKILIDCLPPTLQEKYKKNDEEEKEEKEDTWKKKV